MGYFTSSFHSTESMQCIECVMYVLSAQRPVSTNTVNDLIAAPGALHFQKRGAVILRSTVQL